MLPGHCRFRSWPHNTLCGCAPRAGGGCDWVAEANAGDPHLFVTTLRYRANVSAHEHDSRSRALARAGLHVAGPAVCAARCRYIYLTFDGAKSFDLTPEEQGVLQAEANRIIVEHSFKEEEDDGQEVGGDEAAKAAGEKKSGAAGEEDKTFALELDDLKDAKVLQEKKPEDEDKGGVESAKDVEGGVVANEEVFVEVSIHRRVAASDLVTTLKNLGRFAAAGQGTPVEPDDKPVTVTVGGKTLTLVLAASVKPEPEKPENPGKSGKLETPETPGNPAKEVGGFVFKFCFLIVCASEPTFAFWKQACASMADARTATTWSYC